MTVARAKNAGTASSMTWLVYLIDQVWMASQNAPSGESTASSVAVAAPKIAWTERATVNCGSGRLAAGPAVVGRSGTSALAGSGAIAIPVTILDSGGCSVR